MTCYNLEFTLKTKNTTNQCETEILFFSFIPSLFFWVLPMVKLFALYAVSQLTLSRKFPTTIFKREKRNKKRKETVYKWNRGKYTVFFFSFLFFFFFLDSFSFLNMTLMGAVFLSSQTYRRLTSLFFPDFFCFS